MLRIALRLRGSRKEIEYSLPVTEEDLTAARKACRKWMKTQTFNPLDGAWGVQVEYGFIRPNVLWYAKLKDLDRLIALHAIADRHCKIVEE